MLRTKAWAERGLALFYAATRGGKGVRPLVFFCYPVAEKTSYGEYTTRMTCMGINRHVAYRRPGDAGAQFKCPYCGHFMV